MRVVVRNWGCWWKCFIFLNAHSAIQPLMVVITNLVTMSTKQRWKCASIVSRMGIINNRTLKPFDKPNHFWKLDFQNVHFLLPFSSRQFDFHPISPTGKYANAPGSTRIRFPKLGFMLSRFMSLRFRSYFYIFTRNCEYPYTFHFEILRYFTDFARSLLTDDKSELIWVYF